MWSGSEVVDRASMGDSALVLVDSNALLSVGGLECEQSLLSLRGCVLGTVRSTVAPAYPSSVGRIVGWERGCSRWEGLCGEAIIGCRSGSVMFGVVDAWSYEGAMFVGIVER